MTESDIKSRIRPNGKGQISGQKLQDVLIDLLHSVKDGAQGKQGARGSQGFQGPQGIKGSNGTVGPQGKTGAQGRQGAQGLRGADGAYGAKGEQGPQGKQGPEGRQGSEGARGTNGQQGPQGPAGKISQSLDEWAQSSGYDNFQSYIDSQSFDGMGTTILMGKNIYYDGTTLSRDTDTIAASISGVARQMVTLKNDVGNDLNGLKNRVEQLESATPSQGGAGAQGSQGPQGPQGAGMNPDVINDFENRISALENGGGSGEGGGEDISPKKGGTSIETRVTILEKEVAQINESAWLTLRIRFQANQPFQLVPMTYEGVQFDTARTAPASLPHGGGSLYNEYFGPMYDGNYEAKPMVFMNNIEVPIELNSNVGYKEYVARYRAAKGSNVRAVVLCDGYEMILKDYSVFNDITETVTLTYSNTNNTYIIYVLPNSDDVTVEMSANITKPGGSVVGNYDEDYFSGKTYICAATVVFCESYPAQKVEVYGRETPLKINLHAEIEGTGFAPQVLSTALDIPDYKKAIGTKWVKYVHHRIGQGITASTVYGVRKCVLYAHNIVLVDMTKTEDLASLKRILTIGDVTSGGPIGNRLWVKLWRGWHNKKDEFETFRGGDRVEVYQGEAVLWTAGADYKDGGPNFGTLRLLYPISIDGNPTWNFDLSQKTMFHCLLSDGTAEGLGSDFEFVSLIDGWSNSAVKKNGPVTLEGEAGETMVISAYIPAEEGEQEYKPFKVTFTFSESTNGQTIHPYFAKMTDADRYLDWNVNSWDIESTSGNRIYVKRSYTYGGTYVENSDGGYDYVSEDFYRGSTTAGFSVSVNGSESFTIAAGGPYISKVGASVMNDCYYDDELGCYSTYYGGVSFRCDWSSMENGATSTSDIGLGTISITSKTKTITLDVYAPGCPTA